MNLCFVVNAIADKDVDKFHDGRSKEMNLAYQPLVTGEIGEKEALYLSVLFLLGSLFFAWRVSPSFGVLILIVDVLGYVYSMPPIRFKARPVGDILCNTLAGGTIFIAGLSIGGAYMNINMKPFIIVLVISGVFVMASIFYIPTAVTDHEFDRRAGLRTSAVFFGPKKLLSALYPLTTVFTIIWVLVFLTCNLELKVLAVLVIIYTIAFTLTANFKLRGDRLYIHQNWILVPFAAIAAAFVVYGVVKILVPFFGIAVVFLNSFILINLLLPSF
jgi:chlorophyll synthase